MAIGTEDEAALDAMLADDGGDEAALDAMLADEQPGFDGGMSVEPTTEAPAPKSWTEKSIPDLLGEAADFISPPDPVVEDSEAEKEAKDVAVYDALSTMSDPDKAAAVKRLASMTGVSERYATDNFDRVTRSWEASQFDARKWREENPEDARLFFKRPDLAGMVGGTENLSIFARGFRGLGVLGGAFMEQATTSPAKAMLTVWPPSAPLAAAHSIKGMVEKSDELSESIGKPGGALARDLSAAVTPQWVETLDDPRAAEGREAGTFGRAKMRFEDKRIEAEIGRKGFLVMLDEVAGSDTRELEAEIVEAKRKTGNRDYLPDDAGPIDSIVLSTGDVAGSMASQVEVGVPAAVGGAALGLAAGPGGAAAGALGAYKAAAGLVTFPEAAGGAYLSLRDTRTADGKFVDRDVAMGGAILTGIAEAGSEYISFGSSETLVKSMFKGFTTGNVRSFISRKMVSDPAFREGLKQVFKNYLTVGAKEAGEEIPAGYGTGYAEAFTRTYSRDGLGGMTRIITGEAPTTSPAEDAAGMSLEDPGEGAASFPPEPIDHIKITRDTMDQAAVALEGMMGGGVIFSGGGIVADVSHSLMTRARAEATDRHTVKGAIEIANSPLGIADPEAAVAEFKDIVRRETGGSAETFSGDPEEVSKLFQTEDEMSKALGPEGVRLVKEAIATGDLVTVPTDTFMGTWAKIEKSERLIKIMTTSRGIDSEIVAKKREETNAAEYKRALELYEADNLPTPQTGEQAFRDEVTRQLAKAGGYTLADARVMVAPMFAGIRTLANRMPDPSAAWGNATILVKREGMKVPPVELPALEKAKEKRIKAAPATATPEAPAAPVEAIPGATPAVGAPGAVVAPAPVGEVAPVTPVAATPAPTPATVSVVPSKEGGAALEYRPAVESLASRLSDVAAQLRARPDMTETIAKSIEAHHERLMGEVFKRVEAKDSTGRPLFLRDIAIDINAKVYNDFGLLAIDPDPKLPMLAFIDPEGSKAINDIAGHEALDGLFRMFGVAFHKAKVAPWVAKVGGSFVVPVRDLEHANEIIAKVARKAPSKKFQLRAAVVPHEKGMDLRRVMDAAEAEGKVRKEDDAKPEDMKFTARGDAPVAFLAVGEDGKRKASPRVLDEFGKDKADVPADVAAAIIKEAKKNLIPAKNIGDHAFLLRPEVIAKVDAMPRVEVMTKTYFKEGSGLYSLDAWTRMMEAGGFAVYGMGDLAFLREMNDAFMRDMADVVIDQYGIMFREELPDAFIAHPHGDEYSVGHHDKEILLLAKESVQEDLGNTIFIGTNPKGQFVVQAGVYFGLGINEDAVVADSIDLPADKKIQKKNKPRPQIAKDAADEARLREEVALLQSELGRTVIDLDALASAGGRGRGPRDFHAAGVFGRDDEARVREGGRGVGEGSGEVARLKSESGDKTLGYTERTPDGKSLTVTLTPDANLSTFLHETAHVFHWLLADLAARPDAPQSIKDDWAASLRYMGVEEGKTPTRDQYEKFARGFERYLYEGKAPSEKMRSPFLRYSLWLRGVYRTLAGSEIDVQLSDEVVGVFDRLLASDEEITRQANEPRNVRMFASAEEAGMTPESWAKYVAEADAETLDAARRTELAMLKEHQRITEDWWKTEERRERELATSEYAKLPAVVANRKMRGLDEEGKRVPDSTVTPMNAKEVRRILGTDAIPKGILAQPDVAMTPDVAAELYGFPTGKALLDALSLLDDEATWVKKTASARMNARYPDMLADRERLSNTVAKMMMGDEAKVPLAMRELNLVRAKAGLPAARVENIERSARDIVSKKIIGDLSYRRLDGAANRSAVVAAKASTSANRAARSAEDAIVVAEHFARLAIRAEGLAENVEASVEKVREATFRIIEAASAARNVAKVAEEDATSLSKDAATFSKSVITSSNAALRDAIKTEKSTDKTRSAYTRGKIASRFTQHRALLDSNSAFRSSFSAYTENAAARNAAEDVGAAAELISESAASATAKTGALSSEISSSARAGVMAANEAARQVNMTAAAAWRFAERAASDAAVAMDDAAALLVRAEEAKRAHVLDIYIAKEAKSVITKKRDKMLTLTKKMDSKAWKKRAGLVSPGIRDGAAGILHNIGSSAEPAVLDTLGKVIPEFKRIEAVVGEDLFTVDDVIKKSSGDWQTMSVKDFEVVYGALSQIAASVSSLHSVLMLGKTHDVEEFKALLLSESLKAKDTSWSVALTDEAKAAGEKAGDWFSSMDASSDKIAEMFLRLGGGDFKSHWYSIFLTASDAMAHENDLMVKFSKPLLDLIIEAPVDIDMMGPVDGATLFKEWGMKGNLQLKRPTRVFEIAMMMLHTGTVSSQLRLTQGYNITLDEVRRAADLHLSPKTIAWLQKILDVNESMWPESSALEERAEGIVPKKLEKTIFQTMHGALTGYMPAVYDSRVEKAGSKQEKDYLDPNFVSSGTSTGYMKSRVEGFTGALSLSPGTIMRHFNGVAHDISHREALRSIGRLINDQAVKEMVIGVLGEEHYNQLDIWLSDVGRGAHAREMKGTKVFDNLAKFGKTFIAVRALAGAIPTPLGDLSNPLRAVIGTDLKVSGLMEGLYAFATSPNKTYNEMLRLSGEQRARSGHVANELALAISSEMKSPLFKSKAVKFLLSFDSLFATLRASEIATRTPIWTGAHRQALKTMSKEDAVRFANLVVERLFPSAKAVHMPAIMRTKSAFGGALMFFGYFANEYAQVARMSRGIANARGFKATTIAAATLLGYAAAAGMFESMLSGRGPPPPSDGEDEPWELRWARWATMRTLLFPMQTNPIGLELVAGLEAAVEGKPSNPRGIAWVSVANDLAKALRKASAAEEPEAAAEAAISFLLPAQARREIALSNSIKEGETNTGNPFRLAAGAAYGVRENQGQSFLSLMADGWDMAFPDNQEKN